MCEDTDTHTHTHAHMHVHTQTCVHAHLFTLSMDIKIYQIDSHMWNKLDRVQYSPKFLLVIMPLISSAGEGHLCILTTVKALQYTL